MYGIQSVAKFQTHLKTLMLAKSVELGYPLTQKELAQETGLSLPTISRWYKSDVDRLEPETAARLMGYFRIKLSDLVEVVD